MDQLTFVADECDNEIPWPRKGIIYDVEFEVEHVGRGYDDTPTYTLRDCHDDLGFIFAEHGWDTLIHESNTPIASGVYTAKMHFWGCGSGEDVDYGFDVTGLKFVRSLTPEEATP